MNRLKHRNALWINITSCCYTHPSLNHSSQVSNYVTEHIAGNYHIKPLRILYHPHTDSINKSMVFLYRGIFLSYLFKHPLPEIMSKDKYICLITKSKFAFFISLFGIFKSISDTPLYSLSRVYHLLNSNLILCPFLNKSAHS